MPTDRINELVNLLHRSNPLALTSLQEKFPDQAEDLTPGGTLGDTSFQVRLNVALATLKEFRPGAQKALERVKGKIRASQWLDASAQGIAAIGGSTAVFGEKPQTTFYGGLVALLGSLASLAVKLLRRDFSGAEGGLPKIYSDARDVIWKARECELILEQYAKTGDESDEAKRTIAEANELAGKLNAFLSDYA